MFQPEGNFREQLHSLTESFVKLKKDELENYSSNHEAFLQYHQQFRNQKALQYKALEDKGEQLDSLTESFIKLEKDELENYSSTHEAVIQYRQRFRQYIRDNLGTLKEKAELFFKMVVAVPISFFVLYILIFHSEK